MERKQIDVNGVQASYLEAINGIGRTLVVLLHGFALNAGVYEQLGDALAVNGRRVVIPDLPGFGNTPPIKEASIQAHCEFMMDFICKLQPEKNIILIGHSMGGAIAILLAEKYPYMFKQVILINSSGAPIPVINRSILGWIWAAIKKTWRSFETLRPAITILQAAQANWLRHPYFSYKMAMAVINAELTDLLVRLKPITNIICTGKDDFYPVEGRDLSAHNHQVIADEPHDWPALKHGAAAEIINELTIDIY